MAHPSRSHVTNLPGQEPAGTTRPSSRTASPAPSRRELVYDLLLFAFTVVLAAWQRWSATDLIWGLWISSLVVGYSFIVTALASAVVRARREVKAEKPRPLPGMPGPIASIVTAAVGNLFLLGFFSVHFLGFHTVHAMFLNEFFPLDRARLDSFMGPARVLPAAIGLTLARYWPFVLAGALSRLSEYRSAFGRNPSPLLLFRPYLNVVRMHVLIFVFAFLHMLGLESLALYPVLVFYFFPLGQIFPAVFRGIEWESPKAAVKRTASRARRLRRRKP